MNRSILATPPRVHHDVTMSDAPITLAAYVQRGPLLRAEAISIIGDVFVEVAAVHAEGRLDNALSAERVIVNAGRARLSEKIPQAPRSANDTDPDLGDFDAKFSRFAFMAPEEVRGASPIDGRADTYAMGALAFVALTGKLPFQSTDALRLVAQKLAQPPPTLSSVTGRAFPALLELFVATAMSTDRERRYPNIRVAHAAWRIACAA